MHQVSFDTRFHKQPDALFYEEPRLVTHVDLKFALRLQELYGKRLLPGSPVWVGVGVGVGMGFIVISAYYCCC